MQFINTIYKAYIAILGLIGHSHNVLWVIVIMPNPGVWTLRKKSCVMHNYGISCAHFKDITMKKRYAKLQLLFNEICYNSRIKKNNDILGILSVFYHEKHMI